MDGRVTPLTQGAGPRRPPLRPRSVWSGTALVVAGIAVGYLLAPGTTSSLPPADTEFAEMDASEPPSSVAPPELPAAVATPELPAAVATPELRAEEAVRSPDTILSVEFGPSLVTWHGNGDPAKIRLASDVSAAAYDAAQSRIAVTLEEFAGDGPALHVGNRGDLRFVTSGVTSFAWHPTDPSAIAWVEEAKDGFALVKATVSDGLVRATQIAVLRNRIRLVAWGSWGFAVQSDYGLTTIAPSGTLLAHGDVEFVAAGSDGRLVLARPAGVPLSRDWAITHPDLVDQLALNRFGDPDEHPVAAAILPQSGRMVLVSNRLGDDSDRARIEILHADGTPLAVIRSPMIADSIAWSPDEARLAVGGYHDGPDQPRWVVLLVASDGTGEAIEVPFDHEVRPLGIRR